MPGVWPGGRGEYEKALRQEYATARQRLQARLGESRQPLERQAVTKELEDLKKDFERRLRGIGRSLFGAK